MKQSVHGGAQAWRQRHTEQTSITVDRVEGGCRTEVDDDGGYPIQVDGRERVDDAVRSHLVRVVDGDGHPRVAGDFDLNEVGVPGEIVGCQLLEDRHHCGHGAGHADPCKVFEAHASALKEPVEQHGVLVGHADRVGFQAPGGGQLLSEERAKLDVRIPDIDGQQHFPRKGPFRGVCTDGSGPSGHRSKD